MNNTFRNLQAVILLIISFAFLMMTGWILTGWFVWALFGGIIVFLSLQQEQYRQNLLVISILGFLLGWRGISFSSSFIIYPTELFIWLGLIIYLLDRILRREIGKSEKFYIWEILLSVFALISVITAVSLGRDILGVFFPFKSFIVFIPMLILFRKWIQTTEQIMFYAKVLTYVGVVISGLGLIEKYVPQIGSILPDVILPGTIRYNFEFGSSIEVAGFSLWGTPVVSTLLVLFSGMAAFLPKPQNGIPKIIWLSAFPLLTFGIVASGYRSAWLGLAVIFTMLLVFNHKQNLPVLFLSMAGSLILFSSQYLDRFQTIFFATHSQDPTFVTRSVAAEHGFRTIQNNLLFGTGWNSPTAFNDWINIGVTIGVFGLLVFIIWYGLLIIRLANWFQKSKMKNSNGNLYLSFLASLLGYAVSMVSGAMTQVFPIMTGFWFIFCLGWRLVEISRREELTNGKVVSVVTGL